MRFDPTVNGNGGGGAGNGGPDSAVTDTSTHHPIPVAFDTNTATNAANRDYAQPVFAALDGPFATVTSGYAGAASDGLVQLDTSRQLTSVNESAANGNIVQVAEVERGRHGHDVTFALGFGATQAEAVDTAEASLDDGFKRHPQGLREGLGALRQEAQPTARVVARPQSLARSPTARHVLPQHQRGEGRRRQDLPRRDRRRAVVAVGPGRVGR